MRRDRHVTCTRRDPPWIPERRALRSPWMPGAKGEGTPQGGPLGDERSSHEGNAEESVPGGLGLLMSSLAGVTIAPLEGSTFVIGRAPDADVAIAEPSM